MACCQAGTRIRTEVRRLASAPEGSTEMAGLDLGTCLVYSCAVPPPLSLGPPPPSAACAPRRLPSAPRSPAGRANATERGWPVLLEARMRATPPSAARPGVWAVLAVLAALLCQVARAGAEVITFDFNAISRNTNAAVQGYMQHA